MRNFWDHSANHCKQRESKAQFYRIKRGKELLIARIIIITTADRGDLMKLSLVLGRDVEMQLNIHHAFLGSRADGSQSFCARASHGLTHTHTHRVGKRRSFSSHSTINFFCCLPRKESELTLLASPFRGEDFTKPHLPSRSTRAY